MADSILHCRRNVLILVCMTFPATPAVASASLWPLFRAIEQVESGGNVNAVGDEGRSLGPYQIQYPYWKDSGVPGRYEWVKNRAYARRVMVAYWQRYCPDALARRDYRTLARVHNGGPKGATRAETLPYWGKVSRALRR